MILTAIWPLLPALSQPVSFAVVWNLSLCFAFRVSLPDTLLISWSNSILPFDGNLDEWMRCVELWIFYFWNNLRYSIILWNFDMLSNCCFADNAKVYQILVLKYFSWKALYNLQHYVIHIYCYLISTSIERFTALFNRCWSLFNTLQAICNHFVTYAVVVVSTY